MEWIDINVEKPSLGDVGQEFLVAVKMTSRYEYQIAEFWDMEDGETEPYFNIAHSWCGQQSINKEVTHWMRLPELPEI